MNRAEVAIKKIKKYQKRIKTKNKERIKQQHSEQVQCSICGCHLNKSSISAHQKSKKCKSFVKPIENEE